MRDYEMNRTLSLAIPSMVFLASCGGSSTGNTDIETLWSSPNGSGAGVVRATDGEMNSVALVSNVDDAGKYRSFEIVEVVSETLNTDGSVSGEIVVRLSDGTTANVIGRFYEEAALYAAVNNDATDIVVVAGGTQASNLPVGTYGYSGYAESLYAYGGNLYNEEGSFTMNVQFASGTAQLIADTDESRYFNNDLIVNSTGEISGTNGTFIVYDTDGSTELDRRSVEFNGTFHGSGATHVSGAAVGGSNTNDLSMMGIVGQR